MEATHRVSRKDWLRGTMRCPACRVHLNAQLDLDSYVRAKADTRAAGAIVTHPRCGRVVPYRVR